MRNQTAYSTNNPMPQNGLNAGAASEQQGWEAYYNYAQQLHNSGYTQEAQQYHAYAEQLYAVEVQEERQAVKAQSVALRAAPTSQTVSRTPVAYQSSSTPNVQQESGGASSQSESWEVLYDHAQELYMAGRREEADRYKKQADALYAHANKEQDNHGAVGDVSYAATQRQSSYPVTETGRAGEADAYAPPSRVSQGDSYSYTPPAPAENAVAQSTDHLSTRVPPSDVTRLIQRPTPPRPKGRIKLWILSILMLVFAVAAGGYVGLFHLYKQQQAQKADSVYYSASIWSKVKRVTTQPMINVLKPAFDKTIRLSAAAQPLLYELSLRDRRPENYGSDSQLGGIAAESKDAGASIGTVPVTKSGDDVEAPGESKTSDATPLSSASAPSPLAPSEAQDSDPSGDASSESVPEPNVEAAPDVKDEGNSPDVANPGSVEAPEEKTEESSAEAESDGATIKKASRQWKPKQKKKAKRARRPAAKKAQTNRVASKPANRSAKKKSKPKTNLGNDPMSGMSGLDF